MRGKVKFVKRSQWYVGNQSDQYRSDVHDVRFTTTNAILYDSNEVVIDEDDIREYYNRKRINDSLVKIISDSLHNVWIDYYEDNDGVFWLRGSIDDYL